jgi:hypothetical protein
VAHQKATGSHKTDCATGATEKKRFSAFEGRKGSAPKVETTRFSFRWRRWRKWRLPGDLTSGLPGPGGQEEPLRPGQNGISKGTSEERDGMSKTGFYQCDYPTDTACVFFEDNDLLPDWLRNALG